MKPQWICFLIGHNWDKFAGFYQERVHSTARCKRCEVKYEDTRSGRRSH